VDTTLMILKLSVVALAVGWFVRRSIAENEEAERNLASMDRGARRAEGDERM